MHHNSSNGEYTNKPGASGGYDLAACKICGEFFETVNDAICPSCQKDFMATGSTLGKSKPSYFRRTSAVIVEPGSYEDSVKNMLANPHYQVFNEDSDAADNCGNVVIAMELRARGQLLHAKGGSGFYPDDFAKLWMTKSGNDVKFHNVDTYSKPWREAVTNALLNEEPGSRGAIAAFRRGSEEQSSKRGHIWNWEKELDGSISFHDGQDPETTIYDDIPHMHGFLVLRLDNLDPRPLAYDYVERDNHEN